MSRYTVTVEHAETNLYLAWVHELPGCYGHGASWEEAVANTVPSIERFGDWLRGIGETFGAEPITLDVVEEAGAAEKKPEGPTGVLLSWDRESLTPEDWMRVERWLHHTRMEVLQTLECLREEDLGTIAHEGARSIASQLQHLASVEYMYALWTFDLRSKEGLKEVLDWTRRMALDRMRTLSERRDARLTRAEWTGNEHPEPWTARKTARRLVYHERWHLNSIRRLLQGFRGRQASGAQPQ